MNGDGKKVDHDAIDRVLDEGEAALDEVIEQHGEGCFVREMAEEVREEARGLRVQNARARSSSGPAMVASRAYRSGWDTLFGTKTKAGEA